MKNDDGHDLGVAKFGFKYAVGDVLRLWAGGAQKMPRFELMTTSHNIRLVVLSQTLEVCSGGLQYQYTCRGVHRGGNVNSHVIMFHEHELEPAEPFPIEDQRATEEATV